MLTTVPINDGLLACYRQTLRSLFMPAKRFPPFLRTTNLTHKVRGVQVIWPAGRTAAHLAITLTCRSGAFNERQLRTTPDANTPMCHHCATGHRPLWGLGRRCVTCEVLQAKGTQC